MYIHRSWILHFLSSLSKYQITVLTYPSMYYSTTQTEDLHIIWVSDGIIIHTTIQVTICIITFPIMLSVIKSKLISFLWSYFYNNFDSYDTCTLHFVCPCNFSKLPCISKFNFLQVSRYCIIILIVIQLSSKLINLLIYSYVIMRQLVLVTI